MSILWRSPTREECRDYRQKTTIQLQTVLLIVMAMTIGVQAWHGYEDKQVIQALETLRTANDMQINNLASRVVELEQEIDARELESAIKTSRGSDRTATVTAYTWTGKKTASGTWPKEGRTVAGPRWIPFGTRVYIDGIGWRIVEDRTHERFDGRYDVYMDDHGRCMAWGIQERAVQIK